MRFLRFSQRSRNLYRLPGIDFAQLFIAFIVLLFSLTVHETAHAWTADRLGDPTATTVTARTPQDRLGGCRRDDQVGCLFVQQGHESLNHGALLRG